MLVQVGLDDLGGQLLPVCCLKDKLLAALNVLFLDGLATLNGVLCKSFLREVVGILDDKLAGLQEVIESHRTILLVLRLTEGLGFREELLKGFWGWRGFLEGLLFL